ncbi:MAG: HEAT repeat domain-containing protein [Planctomycetota bacterium]|nr:MAG: HEAT repeat domain-containing protein [Planctomycetota bacterium]
MTWVLAHICAEASVDTLLETLINDDYWKVRRNAAFALGEIGSSRAVKKLIWAMRRDKDRSVRWWSAEALNKIGTPVALRAIKMAHATEKASLARDHMKYLVVNPAYRNHRRVVIQPGQIAEGYCKGTRYVVYVPSNYNPSKTYPLMVAVHGTYSWAVGYIKICQADADRFDIVLLAPHFEFGRFPGFGGLNIDKNSKVRADLRLLEMIDELSHAMKVRTDRIRLFGHSEGGQFVHRFVLAHPDRIERAAACAAAWYVKPDPSQAFPTGIGVSPYAPDLGMLDFGKLVQSHLALVVGSQDSAGHLDHAEQFFTEVKKYATDHNLPCHVRFFPSIGGHDGNVEYQVAREFLFADDLSRFNDCTDGPRTIEGRYLFALSSQATAKASSKWGASYAADRVSDCDFSTRWNSAWGDVNGAWVELCWNKPVQFNRVTIDEFGKQRIQAWRLEIGNKSLKEVARGEGVGLRHKVVLPEIVTTRRLRLTIEKASNTPTICELMPHMPFWEK